MATTECDSGREPWRQALWPKAVGALQERAFDSAETATDPPNAPSGEYVILTYGSTFENMPNATETVATVKQEDGSWKVAGYFVQPA